MYGGAGFDFFFLLFFFFFLRCARGTTKEMLVFLFLAFSDEQLSPLGGQARRMDATHTREGETSLRTRKAMGDGWSSGIGGGGGGGNISFGRADSLQASSLSLTTSSVNSNSNGPDCSSETSVDTDATGSSMNSSLHGPSPVFVKEKDKTPKSSSTANKVFLESVPEAKSMFGAEMSSLQTVSRYQPSLSKESFENLLRFCALAPYFWGNSDSLANISVSSSFPQLAQSLHSRSPLRSSFRDKLSRPISDHRLDLAMTEAANLAAAYVVAISSLSPRTAAFAAAANSSLPPLTAVSGLFGFGATQSSSGVTDDHSSFHVSSEGSTGGKKDTPRSMWPLSLKDFLQVSDSLNMMDPLPAINTGLSRLSCIHGSNHDVVTAGVEGNQQSLELQPLLGTVSLRRALSLFSLFPTAAEVIAFYLHWI